MNIRSCFQLALNELVHSLKNFILYALIFISVMTVSASLIQAAYILPSDISSVAEKIHSDRITAFKISPEVLTEISDRIEVLNCYAESHGTEMFGEKYSSIPNLTKNGEGIIFTNLPADSHICSEISKKLISGTFDISQKGDLIWISEEVSNITGLKFGSSVKCESKNGDDIELEIAGIYSNCEDLCCYYYREETFYKIKREDYLINVLLRGTKFTKLDDILDHLERNGIEYRCNDTLLVSMRIMYAAFYSCAIILIVSIGGIVVSMINMYYNRRKRFFTIGNILGMKRKDIVMVLFFIVEIILLFCELLSSFFSIIFMKKINTFVSVKFACDFHFDKFPLFSIMVLFIFVQICLIADIMLVNRKISEVSLKDMRGGMKG